MAGPRDVQIIKKKRNEILVALKMVYPAAMQSEQIMRSLLSIFPDLEFDQLRKDLHYLIEKGYVTRVVADSESEASATPWRKRWMRLTPRGMEVADECVRDPAIH